MIMLRQTNSNLYSGPGRAAEKSLVLDCSGFMQESLSRFSEFLLLVCKKHNCNSSVDYQNMNIVHIFTFMFLLSQVTVFAELFFLSFAIHVSDKQRDVLESGVIFYKTVSPIPSY